MKFTVLLMMLTVFQARAELRSQELLLNLKLTDVSLIEVLKSIEAQSNYTCLYSYDDVAKVAKLDVNLMNVTIQEVLSTCLKGTTLGFKIVDQTIVIRTLSDMKSVKGIQGDFMKGRVLDVNKDPLPGVTILIKGTTVGCATDTAGRFTLPLPKETKSVTLVFRFVGMEIKEIKLKDITNPKILKGEEELLVTLVEQAESLDDVVVTGYANVRKESYTGTSVRIEGKDILKVANRNIISALQVFDPSFRIMENNMMGSNPNAIPEFYVRGQSGVGVRELDVKDVSEAKLKNNPNLPIFILDGFDVSAEKIYDMDPTRVHSITILKDAAATAIYGSRASNGVIVVETKAPKAGKLNVNYNLVGSITTPDLSSYDYFNAQEKFAAEVAAGYYIHREGDPYPKVLGDYIDRVNALNKGVNTYWLSQPLRTGYNYKHSLYVDGGNDAVRYGIELRYDKENGVMKKSYRNRIGAGLYIDYRLKNLQIRNHVSYDRVNAKNSPFGSFGDFVKQSPYNEMKDETGHYLPTLGLFTGGNPPVNPMYEGMETKNHDKNYYEEFTNNFSLDWYITDFFRFKGQIALTKRIDGVDKFMDPKSGTFVGVREDLGELKGSLSVGNGKEFRWTSNLLLIYNQTLGNHYLTGTLGLNTTETKTSATSAFYKGFPSGNLSSIMYAQKQEGKTTETDNHTRLFGTFLTFNYSFKDIYLFDVSCRVDGSSEFGADKKWAPFWSTGFGLNLHRYSFLNDNRWISQLKLTTSFGQTGKVNFQPYAAKDIYEIYDKNWYITGMGVQLMALGNSSLGWEVKNGLNVGTEVTLKEGLLYLKGTYYHEKTQDMITEIDIPSSFGFNKYFDNLGEIKNTGFEIQMRSDIVTKKDLMFSVFANLSHNKNEILKISNSLSNYNKKVDEHYNDYNDLNVKDEKYAKSFIKYEEGGSLTSIFGMKSLGIDPSSGQEVFERRDGTITYNWEANEQQIIGDTEPDAKGAFGFNFMWKSLSVYASFMYEFGGQRYNDTYPTHIESVDLAMYNADRRVLSDRWINIGDRTPLKDIADRAAVTRPTSRFVQNYNTLDFNSLSVAWTFDNDWVRKLKINTLKLQFNTSGLFHVSTVKQERGTSYPFARVYDLTLNVGF